jgi:histidine triad (HIT) family protein
MEDCIFCKIASKEEQAPIIYEDETFVIIPSKYPAADTHLLFIPKRHVQSIAHVNPEDTDMIGKIMMLASQTAERQEIKDYKLVFNAGKYAQIPHLHLHLISGNLGDDHL